MFSTSSTKKYVVRNHWVEFGEKLSWYYIWRNNFLMKEEKFIILEYLLLLC